MSLFGASGPKARRAALLITAVLMAHCPELPNVVLDLDED